ncbi:diaminopimelate epimerase [Yunchengibacter salinarum]|uniref:diaminopimelate epimerase n=1 Tax=Yunchengibacter salinarum TaxID=3133399 RepID=UPI0035B63652
MTDARTMDFAKMHGLGNDFVVIDARQSGLVLDTADVRHIADRHRGVGCDQLILLRDSARADVFMEIHNADGSRVGACGNATRCIGAKLTAETGRDRITIETDAGLLSAERTADGIRVDMGRPRLDWDAIPLARPMDTAHMDLTVGLLNDGVAVNLGNPHIVFFPGAEAGIDLARLGPLVEHDALFPERVNVSIATLAGPDHLRLGVWERGAGITQACGTAACAAAVAAHRRGLTGRRVAVDLDGGRLDITLEDTGHVSMTGPATHVFDGRIVL